MGQTENNATATATFTATTAATAATPTSQDTAFSNSTCTSTSTSTPNTTTTNSNNSCCCSPHHARDLIRKPRPQLRLPEVHNAGLVAFDCRAVALLEIALRPAHNAALVKWRFGVKEMERPKVSDHLQLLSSSPSPPRHLVPATRFAPLPPLRQALIVVRLCVPRQFDLNCLDGWTQGHWLQHINVVSCYLSQLTGWLPVGLGLGLVA